MRGAARALTLALALASGGCVTLPVPTARDVDRARSSGHETTLEALTAGRQTYLSRCGVCHQHYAPTAYSAARWPLLVEQMRVRAKLSEADRARIVEYLVVLSEADAAGETERATETEPDAAATP